MDKSYLVESSRNKEIIGGDEAIIILPDIYCQTDYSKHTLEKFAETFERPAFMLDYFYLITNEVNDISQDDEGKAIKLMTSFNANKFVEFFGKVLIEIKQSYPIIKHFIVIGFCFGGRLAYIAGANSEVKKIISFYGAGANTANYVNNKTPIEYLANKRKDNGLKVISFFGTKDESIHETDKTEIKEKLNQANISYTSYEYDAPHAYFQEGRKNYNAVASRSSWEILDQTLN